MPPGRILVIRGGAIGDFILTLPVLAALRAGFPQARLEVLGYRHIAQLAAAGGLADDVRSIEARSLAGFFARRGLLDPALQEYFAGFAVIVSYLYDPEGVFEENVRLCTAAQFLAGPHRPDDSAAIHATHALLQPLQRLAIFDADPVPRLRLAQATAGGPCTVAFHPGSGSERKNWPETRWEQLLEAVIKSTPTKVLLVGGEAEDGRLERMGRGQPLTRVERLFQRPLPELASRLMSCAAFIGHDSGISHLAAALGLPVLVLWAETAEQVWRPRGEKVRVLRGPSGMGLATLKVEAVLRELHALFNAFPRLP